MSGPAEANSEVLKLRIKCKKSQNIKHEVLASISMSVFLQGLTQVTGVPADQMGLRSGFPPKRIYYTENMTVEDSGISTGDTIIVELDTTGEYPGGNRSMIDEAAGSPKQVIVAPPRIMTNVRTDFETSVPVTVPIASVPIEPTLDIVASNASLTTDSPPPPVTDGAQEEWSDAIDVVSLERTSAQTSLSSGRPSNPIFPNGILLRKNVPSDNSCLFSSVQYGISGYLDEDSHGHVSTTASKPMRDVIAKAVKADPVKYCEAFLGRSNDEYTKWIKKLDSWGGAIELSILSEFYSVEINVMDTQHDRMNRFGEDKQYEKRVFLIYDGIHYDPLYMESYDGTIITTMFSSADTAVYAQVMELGREARASHQFTDLKNFTLMCSVCKAQFRGQVEAQEHAEKTGHSAFEETMN